MSEQAPPNEIWEGDAFGRQADADFLIKFLTKRVREREERGLSKSYVLNIDAGWGHGKTYFLSRFQKTLERDNYLVAAVNAWQDDHADDPLLSVVAAVDAIIRPLVARQKLSKSLWEAVKRDSAAVVLAAGKGALKHWAKKAIGDGFDEIADLIQPTGSAKSVSPEKTQTGSASEAIVDEATKALFKGFEQTRDSIISFRGELSRLLEEVQKAHPEIKLPLFVLVDELDRCRPPYAISMLERIKHLFSIDNVVFVLATDTKQLRHAIASVYGAGFDAERYLFRFFDRTYVFEEPSRAKFVEHLLSDLRVDETIISLPPTQT
jgi:predicted KAP-like P-loop ATPase